MTAPDPDSGLHPDTTDAAGGVVYRIADWYARTFGTPTAFAISLVGLAVWVSFIPILGWQRWNAGPGLLGNTFESTGEWFFEVAVLIVGVGVAAKQRVIESHQLTSMDYQTRILEALARASEARDEADRKRDAILAHTADAAAAAQTLAREIRRVDEVNGNVLAQILEHVAFGPNGTHPG